MKIRNLFLFILGVYFIFPISVFSNGFLVLVGGSGEIAGGWSDMPYRWIVEHARNGRIAVISYGTETNWIPDYFKSLGAKAAKNFKIADFITANSQTTYDSLISYDAVLLKGGDQSVYYTVYRNSKTQQALQEIYNRGGLLSGTSAGMAILSPVAYTAQGPSVFPASALANAYSSQISLKNDFVHTLPHPYIFDTHFVQRGRFGRLPAFMAKWYRQTQELAIGIGVDDRTALCIDSLGMAKVFGTGAVSFFFPPEDTNPYDTTQSVLRTGSMRVMQLLHGCSFDLNSSTAHGLQNTIEPPEKEETGRFTLLLSGSDALTEEACIHFVQKEGNPADSIVIVTGSNLQLANGVRSQLESQSAIHINIVQALTINQHDEQVKKLIESARKILFIGNNHLSLMAYLYSPGNGSRILEKIRRNQAISFFAGDNARFAGKTVVDNYAETGYPSYQGELQFAPGLSLLRTTAIMPNTWMKEEIYENTASGLPYSMVLDSLAYGLYLSGTTFARYSFDENYKSFFQWLGGSMPLIVLQQVGGNTGMANQGPNAKPRNIAGFDHFRIRFLAAEDLYFCGEVPVNIRTKNESFSVKVFPNPTSEDLYVEAGSGDFLLHMYDITGRKWKECVFSGQVCLDLHPVPAGIYMLHIFSKTGEENSRVKVQVY